MTQWDAVVVGSGPNGLAAAITLARAGRRVLVREGQPTAGGGVRSLALTLPGFIHDVCSAVHPLGLGSPFFGTLPLAERGLVWEHPRAPAAHPLDDGSAIVLEGSVGATAAGLGADGSAYRSLVEPFARVWSDLAEDVLAPPGLPRHPLLFARFAGLGLRSARGLAEGAFRGERARALFAGLAAHGTLPLDAPLTASFALVLSALAHAVGWPAPRGGAQRLTDALVSYLQSLGGEIHVDAPVASESDLPASRAVFFDLTPPQLAVLAGDRAAGLRSAAARHRRGPGAFKVDWALSEPIPWRAADCGRAGTVHLGGTLPEIAAAEAGVWRGEVPERPYVILVQHTLFDPTRAPAGRHTAWAYCHVPNGSSVDMTARIEAQVERFAPGFRDVVLARSAWAPSDLERHNPNYLGGDIGGGVLDLRQLLAGALPPGPYATAVPGWFLCSSSTPPGGGVHGLCGYHAARSALRRGV